MKLLRLLATAITALIAVSPAPTFAGEGGRTAKPVIEIANPSKCVAPAEEMLDVGSEIVFDVVFASPESKAETHLVDGGGDRRFGRGLLETLATRIAAAILERFPIQGVTVRATKPSPPVTSSPPSRRPHRQNHAEPKCSRPSRNSRVKCLVGSI